MELAWECWRVTTPDPLLLKPQAWGRAIELGQECMGKNRWNLASLPTFLVVACLEHTGLMQAEPWSWGGSAWMCGATSAWTS